MVIKQNPMETRIQKTLTQWFPDAFNDINTSKCHSDYEVLNAFSKFTLKLIQQNDERKREPFKIINILYLNGSLHDRNAIENEFFCYFSKVESPGTLKNHLELMPENLKPIYLKTLLEN
jgi:hypothetical protein